MSKFSHLFQPFFIGSVEISNRIVLTGHGTGMSRDSKVDDRLVSYYEARAKGGVGLIMLGSQQVHPTSPGISSLLCNYDDEIISGLAAVADAVHRHGSKIFGYLSHMGFATTARPNVPWSASPLCDQVYGEVAHSMTESEIAKITTAFADAAKRCVIAGLDGIEVHCGHGLLLHQFLSPISNQRTDRYGGSVENRVRFPSEVLDAVRSQVGADVPVGIRCSGDELVLGGLGAKQMAEIVPILVASGRLDFVDVSAGNDGNLVSAMLHHPPMGLPPAPFASISRRIKQVIDVPVIHGTRIHTASEAENLIAREDADLAGMCRALIADPELPKKMLEGRLPEIVPCVGCEQACLGRLERGLAISCVGNPTSGREHDLGQPKPTSGHSNVVVVGGGPAGMEAARIAACRGHRVTLLERSKALGGRVQPAAIHSSRREWRRLIDQKAGELARLGVAIELEADANEKMHVELEPAGVIVATGALPAMPDIPGSHLSHVYWIDDALISPDQIGKRVLVADFLGRQPAMTSALFFADHGIAVTVASPAVHVGHRLVALNLAHSYREAFAHKIAFKPLSEVVEITASEVVIRNPLNGREERITDFDSIVIAAPGRPNDALASAISSRGIAARTIGDAFAPRDIEAAILEGHMAGREVPY